MPIFRSIQVVYYCIWCSALGVVAEVLRIRCVVLCTVCKFVRWAYRCPKFILIKKIVASSWYLSSFSLFSRLLCV